MVPLKAKHSWLLLGTTSIRDDDVVVTRVGSLMVFVIQNLSQNSVRFTSGTEQSLLSMLKFRSPTINSSFLTLYRLSAAYKLSAAYRLSAAYKIHVAVILVCFAQQRSIV